MKKKFISILLSIMSLFVSCQAQTDSQTDSSVFSLVINEKSSSSEITNFQDSTVSYNTIYDIPYSADFLREHQVPPGYYYLDGYDYISYPSESNPNRILARKNNLFGFLSYPDLEEVIPFIYENTSEFNGEFVAAKKDGKWGIIDQFGTVVLPFQSDYALSPENGIALVYPVFLPCWLEGGSMEPDFTLLTFAFYDLKTGAEIYESDYLIKLDRNSKFLPDQIFNLMYQIPEIDYSSASLESIDIGGMIGLNGIYKSPSIYTIAVWTEDIPYKLSSFS